MDVPNLVFSALTHIPYFGPSPPSLLGPYLVGGTLQNLILEGYALRVVLLEPCFRGVGIREDLDVLGVANLLAGVDVDKNSHWSLFSLRLPQCVSLRSGLNTRSTPRFGEEASGGVFHRAVLMSLNP